MNAFINSIAVGTTAVEILSNDETRTSIIFSPPAANRVTISDSASVSDGNGIVLYALEMPLQINYDDFGSWVCKPLYAISNAGTNTIGILASTGGE